MAVQHRYGKGRKGGISGDNSIAKWLYAITGLDWTTGLPPKLKFQHYSSILGITSATCVLQIHKL